MTFAPTWTEGGEWVRMADVPDRYEGYFSAQFAHPLLVRCAIEYRPKNGHGPTFHHEFVVTPDGVLATLRSADAPEFGVTWPLLEDDGRPLRVKVTDRSASTSYADDDGDEESFLSLTSSRVDAVDERLRSTYGWLRPVRAAATDGVNRTFVYPRGRGDPPAEQVRASFRLADDGFESDLGAVHGTLYVGRWSAGGEGTSLDCDRDGAPDATFDAPCRFVLQLRDGKVVAVEADRGTTLRIAGKAIELDAYMPVGISPWRFFAASTIHVGAWSLVFSRARTSRSTPAATRLGARSGLKSRWSMRMPRWASDPRERSVSRRFADHGRGLVPVTRLGRDDPSIGQASSETAGRVTAT